MRVVFGCRRWYAIKTVARGTYDVVVKWVVRVMGGCELAGTRALTVVMWDMMALWS